MQVSTESGQTHAADPGHEAGMALRPGSPDCDKPSHFRTLRYALGNFRAQGRSQRPFSPASEAEGRKFEFCLGHDEFSTLSVTYPRAFPLPTANYPMLTEVAQRWKDGEELRNGLSRSLAEDGEIRVASSFDTCRLARV